VSTKAGAHQLSDKLSFGMIGKKVIGVWKKSINNNIVQSINTKVLTL